MENEENQNQVSLRFPPPLEIAPRFPQSHNPDDDSPLPKTQNQKARKEPQRLKKPQPPSSGSSFDEKMLCPRLAIWSFQAIFSDRGTSGLSSNSTSRLLMESRPSLPVVARFSLSFTFPAGRMAGRY